MRKPPKRYYWDSCLWIDLITQRHSETVNRCLYVKDLVGRGEARIYTSAYTLAEVWKVQCGEQWRTLPPYNEQDFTDFLDSNAVILQLNRPVGELARKLLREHNNLKKSPDAVHVASCIIYDANTLHTFDEKDLLNKFEDELRCLNGERLDICKPPRRPQTD